MQTILKSAAALCALAANQTALAAPGDPITASDAVTIDPIIDGRLRYETLDSPSLEADAVTLRMRAGAEVKHSSGLALLAEAEATLGIVNDYNAFPYPIVDRQRRTAYATVPDPMNVELNRLQLQYKSKPLTVTVGRQRINLDDQRWVGAVGWRQNEQTFDALRTEATLGPVGIDVSYVNSQRTIWGTQGGPRTAFDGDFALLGAGVKLGPVSVKAFGYLLDYKADEQLGSLAMPNADTQTYGVRTTAAFKLSPTAALNVAASYARQTDWRDNPTDYAADYAAAELGLAFGQIALTGGYELLGSDNGRSVQTPMATLHKFNGWADQFLTTPAAGLQDFYAGAALKFPKVKAFPGLNAAVTWHRFESDAGSVHLGDEWNASLGFKIGRTNLLAKFADFDAALGSDVRKLWLQLDFAY